MYVYIYICTYHIYTYIYTYTYVYIYVNRHMCGIVAASSKSNVKYIIYVHICKNI